MDRMPVEGIAETPAVEDHIARRYRTVELGRYIGAHPSCTLYSCVRTVEQVNVVSAPNFGSRSRTKFLATQSPIGCRIGGHECPSKAQSALCNQDFASGLLASPASR